MTFPTDMTSDAGQSALNEHLKDMSYIEGFQPSQADVSVAESLSAPPSAKFPHAVRWFKHIQSMKKDWSALQGEKKPHTAYGLVTGVVAGMATATSKKDQNDDDIDLFGSDEEEDAELEKLKAQRLAEYEAKKAAKGPGPVAKSSVILDVKPWDDTTDIKEMERRVREITMDGLLWGVSKIVPIGYGINKLQITLVIEDDKVSMDLLEEEIMGLEEFVQSVDTVSFNKI